MGGRDEQSGRRERTRITPPACRRGAGRRNGEPEGPPGAWRVDGLERRVSCVLGDGDARHRDKLRRRAPEQRHVKIMHNRWDLLSAKRPTPAPWLADFHAARTARSEYTSLLQRLHWLSCRIVMIASNTRMSCKRDVPISHATSNQNRHPAHSPTAS